MYFDKERELLVSKSVLTGFLVGLVLVGIVLCAWYWTRPVIPTDVHLHADFKVFLNGADFNFAQEKFMTSEEAEKSSVVHLHGLDGNVIHVHAPQITLGDFFRSLGMDFNSTCFVTDSNESFCNFGDKTLKLFVNGAANSQFGSYQPKDLDRILVSFGNESADQIQLQINSVSDNSCIYSEKCPERGPAPPESCDLEGCKA